MSEQVLDQAVLDEIIRRIVSVAQPEKIIPNPRLSPYPTNRRQSKPVSTFQDTIYEHGCGPPLPQVRGISIRECWRKSLPTRVLAALRRVKRGSRIILFGSAARGEMSFHSDVDLLVVKDGGHRRRTAARIYRHLYGVGAAVDVIVVTPQDVERYRDSHALIIKPALTEGRVVYGRA